MEISYKLINRILMTNLYVKYIMAEYSLTKLSPILFTKITIEMKKKLPSSLKMLSFNFTELRN